MNLDNIMVNTQNSIHIRGSKSLYFDPYQIQTVAHDADFIFLTHEHYDHFEPETVAKLKKTDTCLIAPDSMKKKVLAKAGIAPENCRFYQPNEKYEEQGLLIETIPAYNELKPFHTKGKKWLGYIVTMDSIRYYVSGDTDVNEDIMKVQCDVAMIPIGGFYTMNWKQAAEYAVQIKPKAVIPTHYGSIVGKTADGLAFKKELEKLDGNIQTELKLENIIT